ncbi:hypothetical protein OpiT1DRAFT_00512 [Opitutaceae bacterium TAV1]|nr:hypothetical protein OpiT1DRAFT_00512 [Opitutaceae bacterium TAV1]
MPPRRVINIVNFIRYDEPRDPRLDLLEPVVRQMQLLREAGLPCTWLLQFDALVAGPCIDFLKKHLPENHEVGLWFEINRMHCEAAGVAFRGRDGLNWDYHARAALSVGYSPEDRTKLADTAVTRFSGILGHLPTVIAAWYIDAHTLARFSDRYDISAFAICRDQHGTDGYTLRGAPWTGAWFPSRRNTMIPAQTDAMRIETPVFRLLGPDPVHQYDLNLGEPAQQVMTLEPVYPHAGGNPDWVRRYLDHLCFSPALALAHAQAGQENSFGWPLMAAGYELQIAEFVRRRKAGLLDFECLGTTGEWFRGHYRDTPPQAAIALDDTIANGNRRSIWYSSHHYRINLLLEGDRLYLRDLHLFDENYSERYLTTRCDTVAARFDALPVLDGFGWSASTADRALGHWMTLDADGCESELRLSGNPAVRETLDGKMLDLEFPLQAHGPLRLHLEETGWRAALENGSLALVVRWPREVRTAFTSLREDRLHFSHAGFPYALKISAGKGHVTSGGFRLTANPDHGLGIRMD